MKFDSKVSIVPDLYRGSHMNLQGLLIRPVKEVIDTQVGNVRGSTVEDCEPEEAHAYSLYALVTFNSQPNAVQREWIADFPTEKEAESLKGIIEHLIACSKPATALRNLLDTLEEQLTYDAKENEDIIDAAMTGEAALNGWVRLSNGIYFQPLTGNTFGSAREIDTLIPEHVHIDDIEFNDWFAALHPRDMAILEEYWQTRKATEIRGLLPGIAASILNVPPAEYPYRWIGEQFEVCYNGTWKPANVENFILDDDYPPKQDFDRDITEIELEAIQARNYHQNLARYGDGSDTCILSGKRTNSGLYVHLLTTGRITTSDDEGEGSNSQGCFPVSEEAAKRIPQRFIRKLGKG